MPDDSQPTTPRLTRPFAETVRARALADPEFAQALAEEGEENQCGPDAPVHGAPQTTLTRCLFDAALASEVRRLRRALEAIETCAKGHGDTGSWIAELAREALNNE